jgi:hypothetical protein
VDGVDGRDFPFSLSSSSVISVNLDNRLDQSPFIGAIHDRRLSLFSACLPRWTIGGVIKDSSTARPCEEVGLELDVGADFADLSAGRVGNFRGEGVEGLDVLFDLDGDRLLRSREMSGRFVTGEIGIVYGGGPGSSAHAARVSNPTTLGLLGCNSLCSSVAMSGAPNVIDRFGVTVLTGVTICGSSASSGASGVSRDVLDILALCSSASGNS